MRVALTGTPGTGKSTIAPILAEKLSLDVIDLHAYARENGYIQGRDRERDTDILDIDALNKDLRSRVEIVIDSHLSHRLDVTHVIVLRCQPGEIHNRLTQRGYSEEKARENADSEALDIIAAEAMNLHSWVHIEDTTDAQPRESVMSITDAIRDDEPQRIQVDWSEYMEEMT